MQKKMIRGEPQVSARREQDASYDWTRQLLSFVPHDPTDGVARLRAGKGAKPAKPARAGAPPERIPGR